MSIDTRIPKNILDAHAERVAAERESEWPGGIPEMATPNPDAPIPFVPTAQQPATHRDRIGALGEIILTLDPLSDDDQREVVRWLVALYMPGTP